MIGAIVGDIVGSVYEWHNIKTKDFPFFRPDCFFTDDTVMTCDKPNLSNYILSGISLKKYVRLS